MSKKGLHPDLKEKVEKFADGLNIPDVKTLKADPGIIDQDSATYGGTLPRDAVLGLIRTMEDHSLLLKSIDLKRVSAKTGHVPIQSIDSPVSQAVTENDPTIVDNLLETSMVPYSCKKLKANIIVTTEMIESAGESGMGNFESNLMTDFAKALANDLSHLAIRGDSSLPATTKWNKLLRRCDGLSKLCDDNGANVIDAAGKGIGLGTFAVMKRLLPPLYAQNLTLYRWLFNSSVEDVYRSMFADERETDTGDAFLSRRPDVTPMGIKPIITNTILDSLGDTPVAPTAVVDDTDGTMTVRVATVLPDSTDSSGRLVTITCKATGLSETCEVDYNGSSQNIIETTTALGQDTISTTQSDYTVAVADQTQVYLMDPKRYALVSTTHNWRSYRKFNEQADRYEFTFYYWIDSLLAEPESIVKLDNLTLPQLTDWTAWTGLAS